jgi:hypothetical protein
MRLHRAKRFVWVALIAVLMHAFWPLVPQARAGAPGMVQVLCSVHGTMMVPAEDVPDAPLLPQVGKRQPCAMCAAATVALVGALPVLRIADPITTSVAAPALHSPARPRAPPARS